jgi:hypothetical protein
MSLAAHRLIKFCCSLVLTLVLADMLAGCGPGVDNEPVQGTGTSLCYANFQTCVNPIFDAILQGQSGTVTCSAGGCHSIASGSGGSFKVYPNAAPNSAEMQANYYSAQSFANLDDPPESLLLLKPDATGRAQGVGHAGGNIFPTDTDACHLAIQAWISARVSDPNSSSCAACSVPPIYTCGY